MERHAEDDRSVSSFFVDSDDESDEMERLE